ncbi:MAG: C1 family peptidase [Candidatus Methanogasteraceae archaeon]
MNTRTITPSAASAVIVTIVLAVTLAPAMASQPPDEYPGTIMHPDIEITNSTADQHVSDATGALQLAPLNPDFVAYQKSPLGIVGDHICGYVPPPMDLSHLDNIPVERLQVPGELPSSFDWRDSGNVTPVKDQTSCGTCWTFGTTSVLESAVLINEGAAYNFSEQSVALCVDRSWTYLYNNTGNPGNAGGWGELAAEVFIKKGSVSESCNPYNTTALNCGGSCLCDDCTPVKRVDGYRLATNNGSEIDVIKSAIYDHGPVTMSFYWNSGGNYTNSTWGTVYDYYPSPESANHLVSIIGWNNSVPHPDPDHDGTGAWIVKNSWGTGWGNDGYFYLAYNSSSVTEIAYLEYDDPVPGEELLYWDEAGFVNAVGYGNSSSWIASVFTADQSGNMTHVTFWTTSNNAQYEIYVWDDYFGSELTSQTGTCQEYGYYSIPLNSPIPRNVGQQFTVGVNMTTPGYDYPLPVEYEIPGLVDPPIQSDVSFVRQNDGCPWMDLADSGCNAGLRARMVATFNCTCGDICVNTSGWWRGGGTFNASGTPIQSTVNHAIDGDTICVKDGVYTENVDVNKRLTIRSANGSANCIVDASSSSDHVFNVTADYVTVTGLTLTGATGINNAGIYLNGVQHCNISGNNASNNYIGVFLGSSSDNTLTDNTASSNDWDIYIENSQSTFTDNTLNGTAVSFTHNGDVSLKGVGSPAADPAGRHSIGKFIDAANQSAGAWLFLNFSYSDSDVSGLNESSLAVRKHNGTWYDDCGVQYLDTSANVVGVNITSFGVFAPMPQAAPPEITSHAPETPVRDEPNATRTFNITIDQTVDVMWYINGTIVQDTNTSVMAASYMHTGVAAGVWNVSAVVSNVNGTGMQTWIWNVVPRIPGDVTGNGVVNIGDAVLLFNWVSFVNERGTTYVLSAPDNANVNGDTATNIGDAVLLFNWVSFPNERGGAYVLQ